MNTQEVDKLIHEELLPIQQMFHSYELLANNGMFRFSPSVFKKCAIKIQVVIDNARELAKE